MSGPEKELQDRAAALLQAHGFLVFHQRPALTKDGGYVSAVDYNGVGFPDLVAIRPGAPVILVEVKSAVGKLSKDQQDWLHAASGATSCFYSLLRPNGWVVFQKAVEALGDSHPHPYPATWGKILSDRAWRATMKKAKKKLNRRLEAGEGIGPATMSTTLEWTANEPVTGPGGKTYLYKGHQSDGAICVFGPLTWNGDRRCYMPKPRQKPPPRFQCLPADKVKRVKTDG